MGKMEFLTALSSYEHMSEYLKTSEYDEILAQAAGLAHVNARSFARFPVSSYFNDKKSGCYQFVLKELKKNILYYDWLYSRLDDGRSRAVFLNLIAYRLFPVSGFLEEANCLPEQQFFENDFIINDMAGLHKLKNDIRDCMPALCICVDHKAGALWEVPKLLDLIQPKYCFTLRYYKDGQNNKTVIYARPPKEKKILLTESCQQRRNKRIVALAANEGWDNVQLIKECGAIPYLMYKNHHCDVKMTGARKERYTNLKYIEGVEMEFLPDGTLRTKANYLAKEAKNIDCLMLRGCYRDYFPLVGLYKKCNPQGKIYLALDANSKWMDRIQWTKRRFRKFIGQCDVIGTSGRVMQKHLNEKWPWTIEYIPNGFYNYSKERWDVDFEKKRNIILTVGRLGTKQKATIVLTEAFARIADQIPGWELRLAGSMTEEFEQYLKKFFTRFPELEGRIHLCGNIADRSGLYEEYLNAKIFALPSVVEGGTPNVVAEALYAGDCIAISKIDEYQDATDHGRCGLAAEVYDVDMFSENLLRLCRDTDLDAMGRHAYHYARANFDMEEITAKLYYLIFGEVV